MGARITHPARTIGRHSRPISAAENLDSVLLLSSSDTDYLYCICPFARLAIVAHNRDWVLR
jgi:hypothetical protein